MFSRFSGFTAVSAAVRRFSAAGLPFWIFNVHPEVSKQFESGFPGFRKHRVYETRAEQLNPH